MKNWVIALFCVIVSGLNISAEACTTFVISGKYTPDGRPMLFKNRDTGTLDNALVYFTDGKYDYIGVVNAKAGYQSEVWGGYNSEGFAIMNSAAYNNNIGDTTKLNDREGELMKLALQSCKTVDDFEKMLKKMSKPLGVDANYGVIDAFGGAAYFETGNFGYKKVDANDPTVAPNGILIRTNHSFNENYNEGFGYIRYATAENVLFQAAATNNLQPEYLLNNLSRNLTHSLTGVNLQEQLPADKTKAVFKDFNDFIPRNSTASVMLVKGVKAGENPKATVMWTVMGFPLTTVAVPVLMNAEKKLPNILSMKSDFHAPLCDAGMKLREQCFPIKRGSGKNYINVAVLINQNNDGILQKIIPIEKQVFKAFHKMFTESENNLPDDNQIIQFYDWIDTFIPQMYSLQFELSVN